VGENDQTTTQLGAPIDVCEFACGYWLRGDAGSTSLVLVGPTHKRVQVAEFVQLMVAGKGGAVKRGGVCAGVVEPEPG